MVCFPCLLRSSVPLIVRRWWQQQPQKQGVMTTDSSWNNRGSYKEKEVSLKHKCLKKQLDHKTVESGKMKAKGWEPPMSWEFAVCTSNFWAWSFH